VFLPDNWKNEIFLCREYTTSPALAQYSLLVQLREASEFHLEANKPYNKKKIVECLSGDSYRGHFKTEKRLRAPTQSLILGCVQDAEFLLML
jgi:hypothetical protein